jgi:hypothetical protein
MFSMFQNSWGRMYDKPRQGREGKEGTRKEVISINKTLEERNSVNRHLPPLKPGEVEKSIT